MHLWNDRRRGFLAKLHFSDQAAALFRAIISLASNAREHVQFYDVFFHRKPMNDRKAVASHHSHPQVATQTDKTMHSIQTFMTLAFQFSKYFSMQFLKHFIKISVECPILMWIFSIAKSVSFSNTLLEYGFFFIEPSKLCRCSYYINVGQHG